MREIASCEIEDIDSEIKLANRDVIHPVGIVRDVEVLCGKVKYPIDFLVLGLVKDKFCPIICGRPFLNTCSAVIDFKKEKVSVQFTKEPYEFNFSNLLDIVMIRNYLMRILLLKELLLLLCLLMILCSNIWRRTRMTSLCRKGKKLMKSSLDSWLF